MSWSSTVSTIESTLGNRGLTRLPNILTVSEAPSSFVHRGYSLSVEIDTEETVGSRATGINLVQLQICYLCKSNEDYDDTVDLVKNVLSDFQALSNFAGVDGMATSERFEEDNKKVIWTIPFYWEPFNCGG
jgi:hypothetical protein